MPALPTRKNFVAGQKRPSKRVFAFHGSRAFDGSSTNQDNLCSYFASSALLLSVGKRSLGFDPKKKLFENSLPPTNELISKEDVAASLAFHLIKSSGPR
ncbi:uncharacterized protein CIMG_13000 [Coccidioides immitis RS]|uniref:Uncharacterized protein n=1 Tax=Coccidioides immitis (strain RS) TaxID=246410 RepID=J3K717_COCIM|nr:uncharacterized protein CIMG_13000 [Coccidioides immitis RS]EAS30428.3 hypothetical protein CIMG_13000 [Coccidioides immitis RS]